MRGRGLPAATYRVRESRRNKHQHIMQQYLELPFHEVKASYHFGDGVFDLQSRIPIVWR